VPPRETEILARAVIEDDEHFLLAHTRGASNTFLPGGHVEPGEGLVACLERELEEELGISSRVGDYLGAVEHAWTDAGGEHHEINHCFAVTSPELSRAVPLRPREERLEFSWAHERELADRGLEPKPLVPLLAAWQTGDRGTWWASTLGGRVGGSGDGSGRAAAGGAHDETERGPRSPATEAEIRYADSAAGVTAGNLSGFFHGWPNPPTPDTHLELLERSDEIVLAIDMPTGDVVGFVSAVTDGTLCAYVPLLEVVPSHRGRGIGRELVRRMLAKVEHLYMVDLVCDKELVPFYETFGMRSAHAMVVRNYDRQSGSGGKRG